MSTLPLDNNVMDEDDHTTPSIASEDESLMSDTSSTTDQEMTPEVECMRNNERLVKAFGNKPEDKIFEHNSDYITQKPLNPVQKILEKFQFVNVASKLMRQSGVWAEFWKMDVTQDFTTGLRDMVLDYTKDHGLQPTFIVVAFHLTGVPVADPNLMLFGVMAVNTKVLLAADGDKGSNLVCEVSQFTINKNNLEVEFLSRPLIKSTSGIQFYDQCWMSTKNFSKNPLSLRKHMFSIAVKCYRQHGQNPALAHNPALAQVSA